MSLGVPGPAALQLLLRVPPGRSFEGCIARGAGIRALRRELDVMIGDAARAAHVPVSDLVAVEVGRLAFLTPDAYDVVRDRIRGFASNRGRRRA